ncbi:MAG: hypothetical protein ACI9NC_006198 [Verrucomicrobiales bacterium]|jgi:hypothetical protein
MRVCLSKAVLGTMMLTWGWCWCRHRRIQMWEEAGEASAAAELGLESVLEGGRAVV